MDRVQGVTVGPGNTFREENLGEGIPGTVVPATWLNGIQAELVGIIEAEGITPDAEDNAQVLAALDARYVAGAGLTAETAARIAADAALTDALADEASARDVADVYLTGALDAETAARALADTTESTIRAAADNALSARVAVVEAALPLQQTLVRGFTGLSQFLPLAVPTSPEDIVSQSRLFRVRDSAGRVLFGVLEFTWAPSESSLGTAGWELGSTSGSLAPEVDAAIRELWGIDASADWLHPHIYGDIYLDDVRYLMKLRRVSGGPGFAILGGASDSTVYHLGRISFHIPGVNL